jgi:hypothetical protein
MNYKQFITGLERLAIQPAPDVWSRIEQSILPAAVFSFPRWRILLVAAIFSMICVLPTSLLVANQQSQAVYAYLQPVGSTEYLAVASTSLY